MNAPLFTVASPRVTPRDYQSAAVDACFEAFGGHHGCLVRLPTGCGKTLTASLVAQRWLDTRGEDAGVLVLCHERQLVWQFAAAITRFLGTEPGIEMAERKVPTMLMPRIVVASRATLQLRRDPDEQPDEIQLEQSEKLERLHKFDPRRPWLIIVDEAHRYAAKLPSVRPIVEWFGSDARWVGLTATPQRSDGTTLAELFPAIASDYRLMDIDRPCAVSDGWAVPYCQKYVTVHGVDFKKIHEARGDFVESELGAVLEETKALASVADPVMDLAGDRRTIVFCATVSHARKMAEYVSAKAGRTVAKSLDGSILDRERQEVFKAHQTGEIQYLMVCGLCREGYDDPAVACVAVCRPTKSQSLWEQMRGRGCRPLPGVVDGLATPEARRAAIGSSAKPDCLVIDLVGASGLADCASAARIYASGEPDEIVERAEQIMLDGEPSVERAVATARREAADRRRMDDAHTLIASIRRTGGYVRLAGGIVRLGPSSVLISDQIAEARDMVAELRAILATEQADIRRRAEERKEAEEAKARRIAAAQATREEAERRAKLGAEARYEAHDVFGPHASRRRIDRPSEAVCPIGKHKGLPLANVPYGWLRWAADNTTRDEWRRMFAGEISRRRQAMRAKA